MSSASSSPPAVQWPVECGTASGRSRPHEYGARTQQLSDGSPVDRGGAWLGPDHDDILGLAKELGVGTYKTWVHGAHLLIDDDRTRRYTGLIPKISPLAVISIALAQWRLDRMAPAIADGRPLDGGACSGMGFTIGGVVAGALRCSRGHRPRPARDGGQGIDDR